jgi:hypothetical protein
MVRKNENLPVEQPRKGMRPPPKIETDGGGLIIVETPMPIRGDAVPEKKG